MSRSFSAKTRKTPRAAKRPQGTPRASYRHGRLRDALVEKSLRLMGERADASFTLREVAQRIGVSHSAAYRHFPSKGALLAEIARRGFELLTAALSQALLAGKTPEDVVLLQGRAYVRTALTNPAHFRCMFGPRQFTEAEGREADEACDRAYACLVEAACRLLRITSDAAAQHSATLALWSLVHGLAHLALDQQLCEMAGSDSIERYEQMADEVIRPLLRGLSPPRTE